VVNALPFKKIRTFGQDLINDISRIHRDTSVSPSLDLASRSHHMLLIVSLLRVGQPLRLSEIHQFLNHLHDATSEADVQQYLSILWSLKLVTKKRYGHIDYYSNKEGSNFIRWAFQKYARSRDVT
jgi:hypothetical protein